MPRDIVPSVICLKRFFVNFRKKFPPNLSENYSGQSVAGHTHTHPSTSQQTREETQKPKVQHIARFHYLSFGWNCNSFVRTDTEIRRSTKTIAISPLTEVDEFAEFPARKNSSRIRINSRTFEVKSVSKFGIELKTADSENSEKSV
jgi:hypothetical protein